MDETREISVRGSTERSGKRVSRGVCKMGEQRDLRERRWCPTRCRTKRGPSDIYDIRTDVKRRVSKVFDKFPVEVLPYGIKGSVPRRGRRHREDMRIGVYIMSPFM